MSRAQEMGVNFELESHGGDINSMYQLSVAA